MGACQTKKKDQTIVVNKEGTKQGKENMQVVKSAKPPVGNAGTLQNNGQTTAVGVQQGANNQQSVPANNQQVNGKVLQGGAITNLQNGTNNIQANLNTQLQQGTQLASATQLNPGVVSEISYQQLAQKGEQKLVENLEGKNVGKYTLKVYSNRNELTCGPYPGDRQLISLFNEIKPNLDVADEYHFYIVDKENKRIYLNDLAEKSVNAVVPNDNLEGQMVHVEAITQSTIDLPDDIRSAYATTSHIIGTPKYGDPFEVVTYNHSTKKFAAQQYETESFKILQSFSEFSGQCNGNNKLFLAGSDKKSDGEYTHFVELDLSNLDKPEHVKRLPNLIKGREWNSLLFVPPKYIFIVGGIGVRSVELYNTETETLTHDSTLNQEHSESALIVVNNTYLYLFCGYDYNHDYCKTIERCDLRSKKREWEIVNFVENVAFKPSFFSVAYGKGNSIILLGPHENEPAKKENNEVIKPNTINYIFEFKDNVNSIKPFPNIQPVDETFVCLQKFFVPVDQTSSVLMPAYTSDLCKVLIFNSGINDEPETLIMEKNEFEEYSEDGIRPSIVNKLSENRGNLASYLSNNQ